MPRARADEHHDLAGRGAHAGGGQPWDSMSGGRGMGSAPGWLSFRRIVDIPFETCVAALESWRREGRGGGLQAGHSPAMRAGRARSVLGYLPVRGSPGPGTAAPAVAHEAERRWLVPVVTHRSRTHPLRARPGHRKLLPGRPPPAGLVEPLAPARAGDPGERCPGRAGSQESRITPTARKATATASSPRERTGPRKAADAEKQAPTPPPRSLQGIAARRPCRVPHGNACPSQSPTSPHGTRTLTTLGFDVLECRDIGRGKSQVASAICSPRRCFPEVAARLRRLAELSRA